MSLNDVYAACVVSGCNNELCIRPGEIAFSTCLWKAEYDCYQQIGICEEDADGICGWRQTEELMACINSYEKLVAAGDISSD